MVVMVIILVLLSTAAAVVVEAECLVFPGSSSFAGNDISGGGGGGGGGYYNPNYHASVSTLATSDSNTSYIEISYTVQGDSGDDGSALQGGNGSGSGASYTNETVRTGSRSNLTEKPSCTNTQNGWYTRSGNNETDGDEDVRALQILWGGTLIYDGGSSGIVDGYVVVGNYAYTWGTHRGSVYGWCNNDDCGTCASPLEMYVTDLM